MKKSEKSDYEVWNVLIYRKDNWNLRLKNLKVFFHQKKKYTRIVYMCVDNYAYVCLAVSTVDSVNALKYQLKQRIKRFPLSRNISSIRLWQAGFVEASKNIKK